MSKKTIYLEDAINALHNEIVKRRISEDVNDDGSLDEFDTESILRRLPSAQPEIIKCKDCKHSKHWYKDKRRCFLWHEEGIDVFEDGYCNYAKRRMRGEQE